MGGLEIQHVVSDPAHYSHYECLICQSLVDLEDCLVTTVCSHVFCRTCLCEWLNRHNNNNNNTNNNKKTCPTCNKDLLYANLPSRGTSGSSSNTRSHHHHHSYYPTMMIGSDTVLVQSLEYCQPLAYRVLRRIKVSCPLKRRHPSLGIGGGGAGGFCNYDCTWQGDYCDLNEHLLSPTAHQLHQPQQSKPHQQQQSSSLHSQNTTTTTPSASSLHSTASTAQMATEVSIDEGGDDDDDDMNGANKDSNKIGGGSEETRRMSEPRVSGDNEVSPSLNLRQLAESYKEQANGKFASRHYAQARDLYSQALHILAVRPAIDHDDIEDGNNNTLAAAAAATADPNLCLLEATLFSNRAACHFALGNYTLSLDDAEKALQRDPFYVKAAVRVAKSHVQLGDFDAAVQSLERALAAAGAKHKNPGNNYTDGKNKNNNNVVLLQTELANAQEWQKNYANCLIYLEHQEYAAAKLEAGMLLRCASKAAKVLLANAEADLGLGLVDSASRLATTVIKENPQSIHGYLMRGQASFLSNDLVGGANLLKQAIRLDPDGDPKGRFAAKRWIQLANRIKQARDDFFHRRFQVCAETLGQVIDVCPLLPPKSILYATLHTERAQASLRLKKYDATLKDCALVLYHQDDYVEAWCTRFAALHGLGRHQEVLDDTSMLMEKWAKENDRIRQSWQKADFEVRKANRPDFYALLGISPIASVPEIRKAYKRKSLEYHPDRLASGDFTRAQCQEAKHKFQMLGDALEVLTQEFSRQLYDEGHDLEGIKQRFEAAQRAARQKNNPHGGGAGSYPHHH